MWKNVEKVKVKSFQGVSEPKAIMRKCHEA